MNHRTKTPVAIGLAAFILSAAAIPRIHPQNDPSRSVAPIRVGGAAADITPDKPIPIAGQMNRRLGEYTHDPLTVNAAAFEQGDARAVLISCDLATLPDAFIRSVQADCEKSCGIPASRVMIACTHTHLGPCTVEFLPEDEVNPDYMKRLHETLLRVVGKAVRDLQDVTLYAGSGNIPHMGFNRRGLHKNGKADMYLGSWSDDFAGVAGPRDGEVGVIFARNPEGNLKLVIASFSTHPNCNEGESYYSADIPGAVRSFLRRNLGENLGVVYLTGAAGNTAPSVLENNPRNLQPWRGEEGLKRSGHYLGAEILQVIAAATTPMPDPKLHLAQITVPIPLRPWPPSFNPDDTFCPEYYTTSRDIWPRMVREESPVGVRLSVLRLGDAVICTNPAELYVEHGLAIKKASPAAVTLISELTDGYAGYVPTREAFRRGGYSTWTCPTSKLAVDAGDRIVEHTSRLLREAFQP